MRGEPFTPCRLRQDFGPVVTAGAFLLAATIAYRVDRVAGRTLHCTRWPLDQVPGDAEVFTWSWTPRQRRSSHASRMVHAA